MENLPYNWSQSKLQQIQKDRNNPMHIIRTPWIKAGFQKLQKVQKAHIFVETSLLANHLQEIVEKEE